MRSCVIRSLLLIYRSLYVCVCVHQVVLPNWGIYNRNPIKWLPSAMYQKKKTKSD